MKGKRLSLMNDQDWAVRYWIEQGMPREKVTMGLATYGRTFELADGSQTFVGAAGVGPGEAGKYTREPGFLAYYEVRIVVAEYSVLIDSPLDLRKTEQW